MCIGVSILKISGPMVKGWIGFDFYDINDYDLLYICMKN